MGLREMNLFSSSVHRPVSTMRVYWESGVFTVVSGLAAALLYRVFCQRIRSVQSGSVHIHFNDWSNGTSNDSVLQARLHRGLNTQQRGRNTGHWGNIIWEIFCSVRFIFSWHTVCDPPGLWKSIAGAHSHPRKTVDHFLYCGLIRKVEHDRCCETVTDIT